MSSRHSPTSLARQYRDVPDEKLWEECQALKARARTAGAEADAARQQVSVINRNLVVMHERERRLEDIVLQLSFELGGRGHAPPKPKEYSMNPEEAIDYYVTGAMEAYKKDKRVNELKCQILAEEIQAGQERAEAPPPPPPAPPEMVDRATAVDLTEDDQGREARYRAKAQRLERVVQSLRQEIARPQDAAAAKTAELEAELGALQATLQQERQRVKDKIAKNLELKMKIADIVERAQERDGRRKQRIAALQALLLEAGVAEPGLAPDSSPK